MPKLALIPLLILLATPVWAAVSVHRVIPNKILYRTGEEATVAVVVENPDETAFEGTLRLVETWGVNERRTVTEAPLKLAGREQKSLAFKWNTGSARYGRELAAEILTGDKPVARRAEFFNVINEWWRVNQIVGGTDESDENRKVLAYYHVNFPWPKFSMYAKDRYPVEMGPFLDYSNHANQFSSMPSNFGKMTPDVPEDQTWYNGQCGFGFTTAKLKEDLAWRRKWGIPTSIYTLPTFCGPAGFEIARRRPDWVARDENGAFKSNGYETISPLELANPITVGMKGWYGVEPDLLDLDCVRFGAEELNHTLRMFGWEAVYFDYTYVPNPQYTWRGERKPDRTEIGAIGARNNRLVREIVRKEYPDAYLWANNQDPAQIIPFEPSGNLGGKEAKIEFLADRQSGILIEFQAGQIADPAFYGHSWRALFEIYLGARNDVRLKDWGRPLTDTINTGYVFPNGFRDKIGAENYRKSRGQWAWSNHAMALMAAAQMHPCVGGPAFRPFTQFMTRYSEFLWHEDLRIEKKAFKLFAVDSLRRIWWEDSVCRREKADCEEYILHLVNAPDEEKPHMLILKDPNPADDVEVTLLRVSKPEGIKAWAMMPYRYESTDLVPVQVELKSKIVDGEVVFALPPFVYYAMVVIQKPKSGKAG